MQRDECSAVFILGRRQARVAVDDGAVDPALSFKPRDGLDPSSDSRRSTLIRATRNKVVEARKKRLRQPDSNLLGGHDLSLPVGYANR